MEDKKHQSDPNGKSHEIWQKIDQYSYPLSTSPSYNPTTDTLKRKVTNANMCKHIILLIPTLTQTCPIKSVHQAAMVKWSIKLQWWRKVLETMWACRFSTTTVTSGAPNVNFGKYLFGRRFEIQNFRNTCCKISCLPASPRIFEHIRYNCPFLTDSYPKKVTKNFREPFFWLKFSKR